MTGSIGGVSDSPLGVLCSRGLSPSPRLETLITHWFKILQIFSDLTKIWFERNPLAVGGQGDGGMARELGLLFLVEKH